MEPTRSVRARKLKWNKSNYKELSAVKLPRGIKGRRRRVIKQKLCAVIILERGEDGYVKVHYVNEYDEWKEEDDLEEIGEYQIESRFRRLQCWILYWKLRIIPSTEIWE